jgi:hypothetical protein
MFVDEEDNDCIPRIDIKTGNAQQFYIFQQK